MKQDSVYSTKGILENQLKTKLIFKSSIAQAFLSVFVKFQTMDIALQSTVRNENLIIFTILKVAALVVCAVLFLSILKK